MLMLQRAQSWKNHPIASPGFVLFETWTAAERPGITSAERTVESDVQPPVRMTRAAQAIARARGWRGKADGSCGVAIGCVPGTQQGDARAAEAGGRRSFASSIDTVALSAGHRSS